MAFNLKLKQAMKDLNLNQIQVCGLIGKSKGSVSQYLSGRQIPPEDVQTNIAIALGLDENYFSSANKPVETFDKKRIGNKVVPKMDVETAAKLLQMNHVTVRKGLQQGVFPWGYGIQTSENRWVYFINAKRFMEIEGISV